MRKAKLSFTIIEILLAMGLFVVVAAGIAGMVVQAFSVNRLGEEQSYGNFLASEGLEAVRAITNRDFFNLSYGSHGVSSQSGDWEFSGSSDSFGRFTRTIIISKVYRDASKNIVESGGTLDLFSRRVESKVTWEFAPERTNTVSSKTYFTHWTEPICEWDSAVQVGGLDLPGGGDAQAIEILGTNAYIATRRNGSAGEFFIVSLSDPIAPSLLGQGEVDDHVFALTLSGSYAYLATAKSNAEIMVFDISNPASPAKVRDVDLPAQANDVIAAGGYLYVVTQSAAGAPEFYVFDISSPSNPAAVGSGFEAGNHVYGVYVTEGRAYLANARSDKELIILDVSNPASPAEIGSFDIPNAGANGQTVFYGGGIVHLTTRDNVGPTAEYYLFEASDPQNITLLGSLDTSGRTNGVEGGVGFSILATEKDDQELMIVSTTDPGSLQIDFSLDLDGDAFGVALSGCYGYFTSASDTQELKVVTPQ